MRLKATHRHEGILLVVRHNLRHDDAHHELSPHRQQLRHWARENNRPLIWTDGPPGNGNPDDMVEAMILDPFVGFGGDRITEHDLQLFENHWRVPNRNR